MNGLSHNWRVFREALEADRARVRGKLTSTEADFLPAALEVIERPVSPTARITTWVLLIGLLATLLWLVLGRVDVVVSAPGKTVPTGSVKLVQSAGSGVVRAIYVRDGDRVRKGQALIDLDPTLSGADLEQARKALLSAELDMARNQAIADALSGRGLHFAPPAGTPQSVADTQRQLIAAQNTELQSTTSGLAAARSSALSEASAAAAQRAKLDETVPILDQELAKMERLDAKGYAPGLRLLELQRQRRAEAGDRDIAAAQEARSVNDARKFGQQMAQTRDQARRMALTDLAKAQSEAILRREEVTKASRKSGLQRLVSPVSGTVQQLILHTIGGVVEASRVLMIVVPEQGGLEVEAKILNRDAGFVHEGQSVAVKIDAFPFTRYGTLPGVIVGISHDAVPDPKLGSTYVARIKLNTATVPVEGRDVVLGAGLGVTADIRTGSRPLMSYLLSPIQTTVAQAARER